VSVAERRQQWIRWALLADIAAVTFLAVGAYVAVKGGFTSRLFGIRLFSFRSESRLFLWAITLIAVRHFAVPRPSLPELIVQWVKVQARAAGPLPDDLELLGRDTIPSWPRGTSRRLVFASALTVFFAALTVLMTYPQVRFLGTGVSEDIGDPLFSTWRLSWIAHQIVRDPMHLFDGNIFYPSLHTLAFSDSMLAPGLSAAPLIWLGVPQLVTYNLLFLSGFALSGVGMFVLVRSLTGSIAAALVAGFVFAFLPFRFIHYAHLELQMAQWMPLCLWALHRTFDS
jgi:hypothetical protein